MSALDRATELAFSVVAAQASRRDMTPKEAADLLRALRRAAMEDYQPGEDDDLDDEAAGAEPVGGDPARMRPAPVDLSPTAEAAHAALEDRYPAKRPELIPAVPIEAAKDHNKITCLHCGGRFDTLKRHLWLAHGEYGYKRPPQPKKGEKGTDTVADIYRANWGLPDDYELVADSYKSMKSDIAKQLDLGRIGRTNLRSSTTLATAEATPEPSGEAPTPEAAQEAPPRTATRTTASPASGKPSRRKKAG